MDMFFYFSFEQVQYCIFVFESYMGRIMEKEFFECLQYMFYIDLFGVVQMIVVFCYVEFYVYR